MTTATVPWNEYCLRSHAPRCLPVQPDLMDFCSSLGELELEIHHLGDLMGHAAECDARRGPVLRAHIADLRQIRDEAAALLAEAEAA